VYCVSSLHRIFVYIAKVLSHCSIMLCRKPVKSAEFHSYVTDLERDSGLLFAVQYEVSPFNCSFV